MRETNFRGEKSEERCEIFSNERSPRCMQRNGAAINSPQRQPAPSMGRANFCGPEFHRPEGRCRSAVAPGFRPVFCQMCPKSGHTPVH